MVGVYGFFPVVYYVWSGWFGFCITTGEEHGGGKEKKLTKK